MYRIIVSDDEAAVRERIVRFLKEVGDDFTVVGEYENGYDALLNGLPLEPDLIITDIKMPFITGLELIRRARLELPLVQAIIISGYDDFDYAKEAINLGVTGYLSKPILKEELERCLKKAKEAIDKEVLLPKADAHPRADSVDKLLLEADLNRLVTVKTMPESLRQALLSSGIDLRASSFCFVVFDPDAEDDEKSLENADSIFKTIRECVEEEMEEYRHHDFIAQNRFSSLVLLKEGQGLDGFESALSRILAKAKRNIKASFSCGVSDIHKPEEGELSFRKMYRHALFSLEYRTVIGSGVTLFYDQIKEIRGTSGGKLDENEYHAISYSILYGKAEEAKNSIAQIIDRITSIEFKDSYFLIISNLLDAVLKSCQAINVLYTTFLPHVELTNHFYSFKNPQSVKDGFAQLIDAVVKINIKQRNEGVDESYEQIVSYIKGNYTRSSLSLEEVAEELDYSVSYIYTILKRNGTSFTKLLTNIRLTKAKELLKDPSNKIASIAASIGYDDPYYFSHCFKKCYGVSPLEYRKQ